MSLECMCREGEMFVCEIRMSVSRGGRASVCV